MLNKLFFPIFILLLFTSVIINAAESTMEFNGTTTSFNGITVSFSAGSFTNSSDGSEMTLYANHPYGTPINGGNDYKDISISPATYIAKVTIAWGYNVQGLKLQFLNNNSVVKEIENFNAGGNITISTDFTVNTVVDVIRFLDTGVSSSGGFELSHITFDTAMPVELTSFSATTIGSTVKLSWNTATEVNNYGFEIERCVLSAERQAWEKIGFVNGNGNSNSPKDYSFVDDSVTAGKYSYRLKQIDNDGQFEYSKTIEVDMDGVKNFELSQNYPNPFNPSTTIRFNLPEASIVKLTIFNILGQKIRTLVNEYKESGAYTINFSAIGGSASGGDESDLNSGIYIYKIEAGSFTQTRKMTLLK